MLQLEEENVELVVPELLGHTHTHTHALNVEMVVPELLLLSRAGSCINSTVAVRPV